MARDTEMLVDGVEPPLYEVVNEPAAEQTEAMEGVVEVQEDAAAGQSEAESLSGSYTWVIPNWNSLRDQKLYSSNFEIGTYIWRLLVFPRGNKGAEPAAHEFLAIYLDAPEAAWTPQHMNPRASFSLTVHHANDQGGGYKKGETSHVFKDGSTDWGFTHFMPLADIKAPDYIFPDGSVKITVNIAIQRDEAFAYDSRKETGYVGLKNQGATCYMNSLLQYLYNIPYFRKAVYHMPTNENEEDAGNSMPLALQGLFFKLQYSKTAVSTKDLTRSFGWKPFDNFMQHDVQEFNRVLCEKLEEKMKGTTVERVINELFEGHTYNFIECVNVDYKSTRKESFMDLQLDVKGCKDVYESFDKYTAVEDMVGDNQYKAEEHGLQDAKKGVLFQDFPPVLQLQLKRFEYDHHWNMVKINDRYEFPEELDLDKEDGKYLAPGADRSVRNVYKLHSVLVHQGSLNQGHYYAYIRPDGTTWLKFDDDRVDRADELQALEEQYGGDLEGAPAGPIGPNQQGGFGTGGMGPGVIGTGFKFRKDSNAYMLVYVRKQQWDQYMGSVTKEDIAPYLRGRLEAEQAEKERRQAEKREAHLYCHVKVAKDSDISAAVGSHRWFDLVDYDKLGPESSFRIRKHIGFQEFKGLVAEKLGVPVEQQRYWVWQVRQNKTYRVAHRLTPQEEASALMDLREHREKGSGTSKHSLMDLRLYMETPWPDPSTAAAVQPRPNDILLFLKYYDPKQQQLRFVGHVYVDKTLLVQHLYPLLRIHAGLPEDVPLEVYEEVKSEPTIIVDLLNPDTQLQAQPAQLESGDILVFQVAVPLDEEEQYMFAHVKEFLTYKVARREVTCRKVTDPGEEGFKVELLKDMGYDQITAAIAAKLGLPDPTLVRLTLHNNYSRAPQRQPLKFQAPQSLDSMLVHGGHPTDTLYYEVLDMPLPQLEQLKTLKIALHNDRTEFVSDHELRLPRDVSVAHVLLELQRHLGAEQQGRHMRLLEVFSSRIYKVLDPDSPIANLDSTYWTFRAECIPEDELQMDLEGGDSLVHVYHFVVDTEANANATHLSTQVFNFGDPFIFRIGSDETAASVRERIRTKLNVPPEDFARWKLAYVSIRGGAEFLSDEEVPAQRFAKAGLESQHYLGLGHDDKGPKRPASTTRHNAYVERPVKIYN